jgi:sugar O-acyltransferase (sialic acid O-acetyltransferase NeuD family)
VSVRERLIIVGGGGFGREMIEHASDAHAAGRCPPVEGYLDDGGAEVLARLGYDLPWIGSIADYVPMPGDVFAIGIGGPEGKRQVVERLQGRGARFAQIIHPTALVTRRTSLGEGVVMGPFTGTGTDTRIGRFVTVNSYSGFGHDSRAGEFTTLSAHVDVMGNAAIGDDVFVGSHASILPKVKIGAGARIGAGAMVYRSVPAGATAFAPPAKLLKRG